MAFINSTTLVLPVILAVTALALVMLVCAFVFGIRVQRLPAATRLEDVRERLAVTEATLTRKQVEVREAERAIKERDRFAAEVEALKEQLGSLKAEIGALDSAREEINAVKEDAAKAAAELATVTQALDAKRTELDRIKDDLGPERVAQLRQAVDDLIKEREQLQIRLPELRAERDAALRTIAEARAFEAERAALQAQLNELAGRREEIARVTSELTSLNAGFAQKHAATTALDEEHTRLVARLDALKKEIGEIDGTRPAGEPATLMADLLIRPACLASPAILRHALRTEAQALQGVTSYLRNSGLSYHPRTVQAFHTALKVNDHAQLTVLAGVSGTGKSLLPRRYAEAMGIHFLQIAVEPRWDSPQDLLGFYNYVEKKYRATELARLLVHMDPYRNVALPKDGKDHRDHMALVLLDEMNLARVEYYFSEFLSRLEARPRYEQAGDKPRRRDALIPVDIRGMETPPHLFPAHNVLFAGTMNDDESTQSLSEKVLDRGNVLQFPAPHEFTLPAAQPDMPVPDQAQSFREWRTWVRSPADLTSDQEETVDAVIRNLAEIMEKCGRPFGHRLREAMLAYAANYRVGDRHGLDVRIPLADQIELRIMPKLRGLEIGNHEAQFSELAHLIRAGLADDAFAATFASLYEGQRGGTGLFVWRGLARDGDV